MERTAELQRKTLETDVKVKLSLDGSGRADVRTGIPFFDHMLTLFTVHGLFDLFLKAEGDIEVDFHHTVEDVGLVLGDAFSQALGDRRGIRRYGHAVTPMDETLSTVAIDLSNRPFLVYNVFQTGKGVSGFDVYLAKEFFRAFTNRSGMNLHINVAYGENEHHILESVFKAAGRALDAAAALDDRISGVPSTKGVL
ncbi:imidazoleglycerol-phosphate dehydratase HisB [Desulfococcus sp.]|nr:imidazoleglycerol-phosphate dehydratase HisB [Desulfococcus multivorans]AQV03022.1 imidazoleglycerol-phosphate dehydratase [Desulfococcus multivorans]